MIVLVASLKRVPLSSYSVGEYLFSAYAPGAEVMDKVGETNKKLPRDTDSLGRV